MIMMVIFLADSHGIVTENRASHSTRRTTLDYVGVSWVDVCLSHVFLENIDIK